MNTADMILKKGFGYYDVTVYPYGGSFHRADVNMPVVVIGDSHQPGEVKATLIDAARYPNKPERTIIIRRDALCEPFTESGNLAEEAKKHV